MKGMVLIFCLLAFVPLAVRFPIVGIAAYIWIDMAAPQAVFAVPNNELRLGLLYVIATGLGILFFERNWMSRFGISSAAIIGIFLILSLSTLFAIAPLAAEEKFGRMAKSLLVALMIILIVDSKERFDTILWTIFLAMCMSGALGGIKTLLTGGGGETIIGPEGTHIEDRNFFAASLLIASAIGFYLVRSISSSKKSRYFSYGIWGLIVLNLVAVVGTYSRGGFLGLIAILMTLGLLSRRKLPSVFFAIVTIGVLALAAPDQWTNRMLGLAQLEEAGDTSALGRVERWKFGLSVAMARPFLGGGPAVFQTDANTHLGRWLESHNTYVEVMAELGFPALFLFLFLCFYSLIRAYWLQRAFKTTADTDDPTLIINSEHPKHWKFDATVGLMLAIIALMVCGMFLHMAAHLVTWLPFACLAALFNIHKLETSSPSFLNERQRVISKYSGGRLRS